MQTTTPTTGRLRRALVLGLLFAAFALIASTVQAQPGVSKANRLTFDLDRNGAGQLSSDARTLTVQLPAANAIRNNYRGRTATMRLAYMSSGSGRPQARFVQVSASNSRVRCYIPSGAQTAPVRFTCLADPTWLRTLSGRTTVRIEVGGAGVSGKLQANWVFIPNG